MGFGTTCERRGAGCAQSIVHDQGHVCLQYRGAPGTSGPGCDSSGTQVGAWPALPASAREKGRVGLSCTAHPGSSPSPVLGAMPSLPVTAATYRVSPTDRLLWVSLWPGWGWLLSGQSHDDDDVAEQPHCHVGGVDAAAGGHSEYKLEPRKFY